MEFFKKPRSKFILTALVSLAFFLAAFYGITAQLYKKIIKAQDEILSYGLARGLSEKNSEITRENEAQLEGRAEDLNAVKNIFFDISRPLAFIETLENIAKISLVSLDITPVEGENSSRTFLISTEGDFSSLFKFLKLVENMPYEIRIEEMNLRKEGVASPSPFKMKLDLTLNVDSK